METNVSPIEDLVVSGVGKQFFSLFNYPILFTNSTDKKSVYASKLAANPNLKLPFAFASFVSDEVDTSRYSPPSLARRGVYLAPLNDHTQVFNVKLLPVITTFKLVLLAEDLVTLRKFASSWLFAAQLNELSFSITYGSADFDLRLELEPNLQYPDPPSGVDEPKEYELTSSFKVFGYMSKPWTRQQTATEVQVDGQLKTEGTSTVEVFRFNRKW